MAKDVRKSTWKRFLQVERLEARLQLRLSFSVDDSWFSAIPQVNSATFIGPLTLEDYTRDRVIANGDRWIIRLSEASSQHLTVADSQDVLNGISDLHFEVIGGLGMQAMVLAATDASEAAVLELEKSPAVRYVVKDSEVVGQAMPNDPDYADKQSSFEQVNAPVAWDTTTGAADVVVAVIDSGVDYTHEDLSNNIWLNQNEIPSILIDGIPDTDEDGFEDELVDFDDNGLFTFYDLNDVTNAFLRDPSHPQYIANSNLNPLIDAGDLLDSYWANFEEQNSVHTGDLVGWDYYQWEARPPLDGESPRNDPMDHNGHGTHVAGIIGAQGNNEVGIAGLNWKSSVLPVRFLGPNNKGDSSDAVFAINYVTMLVEREGVNIKVINASWTDGTKYNPAMYDAIERAGDAGILFVAAAGNGNALGLPNNNDVPGLAKYPASYDLDNILSVTAVDSDGELVPTFGFGPTSVDVAAPGIDIYSTLPNNEYGRRTGTSMAAAFVSGAAGLVAARSREVSPKELKTQIINTVDGQASLESTTFSGGSIDLARSLDPNLDFVSPRGSIAADSTLVTSDFTVTVELNDNQSIDTSSIDASDFVVRIPEPEPNQDYSDSRYRITVAPISKTIPNRVFVELRVEVDVLVNEVWQSDFFLVGDYELGLSGTIVDLAGNKLVPSVDSGRIEDRQGTIGFKVGDVVRANVAIIVNTRLDSPAASQTAPEDVNNGISLRSAIMFLNGTERGGTIGLRAGTYSLTRVGIAEDQGVVGDLDINRHITIMGSGVDKTFIDASMLSDRAFDVHDVSFEIRDATIMSGQPDAIGGGGVRLNGRSSAGIVRVNFLGDTWENAGHLSGGAIQVGEEASLSIRDSTISGHRGLDLGGGIYNAGFFYSERNLRIENNSANYGGGIFNIHEFSDSSRSDEPGISLTANRAMVRGGGIYNSGNFHTPNELLVLRNSTVTGDGGGVYNASKGTLSFPSGVISRNLAGGNGGGIFNEGSVDESVENSCAYDGIVADFYRNEAEGSGGAIYSTNGVIWLSCSVLAKNIAKNGNGGGIYVRKDPGDASLVVQYSRLAKNMAKLDGGAIYAGSITRRGVPGVVRSSEVFQNHAGGDGGGIYGVLNVVNSVIVDNSAGGDGGGLFRPSRLGTRWGHEEESAVPGGIITRSIIERNKSEFNGGGVSGHGTLEESTVADNEATKGGGLNGEFNLRFVTATENDARQSAGGFLNTGPSELVGTIIAQNSAPVSSERDIVGGSQITLSGGNLVGTVGESLAGTQTNDIVGTEIAPALPALIRLDDSDSSPTGFVINEASHSFEFLPETKFDRFEPATGSRVVDFVPNDQAGPQAIGVVDWNNDGKSLRDAGAEERRLGILRGVVYQDLNGNAVRDDGEPIVEGQEIQLVANNSPSLTIAKSDANGQFAIGSLPIGSERRVNINPSSVWDVYFEPDFTFDSLDPEHITFADMDQDGDQDLVAAGTATHAIIYYLENVDGKLVEGVPIPLRGIEANSPIHRIELASFDADSIPNELVVLHGQERVLSVVTWKREASAFEVMTDEERQLDQRDVRDFVIADFDRDSTNDLVFLAGNSVFRYERGQGTVDLGVPGPTSTTEPRDWTAFSLGDFNKDNKLDVVLVADSLVGVSFNTQNGLSTVVETSVDGVILLPLVGDVDGDEDVDFVALTDSGVTVLKNSFGVLGDGDEDRHSVVFEFSDNEPIGMVGSFDRNPHNGIDLLVGGDRPYIFRNPGDGRFGPGISVHDEAVLGALTATDVNGDGFADVVTSDRVYLNRSSVGPFTVTLGEDIEGIEIPLRAAFGEIRGRVFNDIDRDGDLNTERETGLDGFRVFIDEDVDGIFDFTDTNSNGKFDAGEPSDEPSTLTSKDDPETFEDESGSYVFRLLQGAYVVRVVDEEGWDVSDDDSGFVDLRLGEQVLDQHFAFSTDGTGGGVINSALLSGKVFVDQDRDGKEEPEAKPVPNVPIFIDLNFNGIWDDDFILPFGPPGEPMDYTDPGGIFTIPVFGPGTYDVYLLDHIAGPPQTFPLQSSISDAVELNTALKPRDVELVDFNGDQTMDAVVAAAEGVVSIHLSTADGRYHPPIKIETQAGTNDVDVRRLDGDDRLDIVVSNQLDSSVTILLNRTDGIMSPTNSDFDPVHYSTLKGKPGAIVAARIDEDEFVDLAVVTTDFESPDKSGNVLVFKNQGDGAFSQEPFAIGVGGQPTSIAAGDVNQDGYIDLVVANLNDVTKDSSLSILLGAGNGQFNPVAFGNDNELGLDDGYQGIGAFSVSLGDIDGKNGLDIVIANAISDTVAVLYNEGDGDEFTAGELIPTGHQVTSVSTIDADLDGDLDILFSAQAVGGGQGIGFIRNDGVDNSDDAPKLLYDPAGVSGVGYADFSFSISAASLVEEDDNAPRDTRIGPTLGVVNSEQNTVTIAQTDISLTAHRIKLTSNAKTDNINFGVLPHSVFFLEGDADLDGRVAVSDFLILARNFGQNGEWEQGNFNEDENVNFTDFLLLAKNFGKEKRRQG